MCIGKAAKSKSWPPRALHSLAFLWIRSFNQYAPSAALPHKPLRTKKPFRREQIYSATKIISIYRKLCSVEKGQDVIFFKEREVDIKKKIQRHHKMFWVLVLIFLSGWRHFGVFNINCWRPNRAGELPLQQGWHRREELSTKTLIPWLNRAFMYLNWQLFTFTLRKFYSGICSFYALYF